MRLCRLVRGCLGAVGFLRAETILAEAEGGRGVGVFGERRGTELEGVVNRVLFGGRKEVYYAKERNGAATLVTACATFRVITEAVREALLGKEGVVQCAYLHLRGIEGGDGMAETIHLMKDSIEAQYVNGSCAWESLHGFISKLVDTVILLHEGEAPILTLSSVCGNAWPNSLVK